MELSYAFLSGYIFTAILHSIGIWILCSVKMALANQRLIILNLALAELLSCIERIIYTSGSLADFRNTIWLRFGFFLHLFAAFITKFIMLLLTLDRFLEIYFHMKYAVYLTRKKLFYILITLWLLSAGLSVTLVLVAIFVSEVLKMYALFFYVYFGIDIVITIAAVSTYIYFFVKVRSFKQKERKLSGHLIQHKQSTSNKFLVPCLTIATYILFNVTGTTIHMAIQLMEDKYAPTSLIIALSHIGFLLMLLGWVSDWMIYIILQRNVRKKLMKTCCGARENAYHSDIEMVEIQT